MPAARPAAKPAATKAPPRAPAAAAKPPPAPALAAYARKLVRANLPKEQAALQKVLDQAGALAAKNPAKAASLQALANAKLELLASELEVRKGLSSAKFQNGTKVTLFIDQVRGLKDGELGLFVKKLEKTAAKNPDDMWRLSASLREQASRQSKVEIAAAAKEQTRLRGVKDGYGDAIDALSPDALALEAKAAKARVTEARRLVEAAELGVASAVTPEDKAAAEATLASAKEALRTEYAKNAVAAAELRKDAASPVAPAEPAVPAKPSGQKPKVETLHDYAARMQKLSVPKLNAERDRVVDALAAAKAGNAGEKAIHREEVKISILDQAIVKKAGKITPVDKTRNPGNVVFDTPGMFIASAAAYPASTNAAKLKAAGVTWVSLQVHNPHPLGEAEEAKQAGWIDQWKAAGFKVGVWGVSYGNAAADGVTAAQMTKHFGADFYIADCEGSFQAGEGDPARNKQFVDAFSAEAKRLGIGNIPRALSSMGRVAIDHQPWIQDGWDAMPQAYWNDWQVYQPSKCVQFYEDWGWPKGRIHPTIGTYNATGDQTVPKSISDYVPDMKASGATGFSYYLPESYLDDKQYGELLAGMAAGMNGPKPK